LSIYVPRKYCKAATRLNDFAINDLDDLSIVPFSLSKNHPKQFYYHMTKHAEFMHDHRNITILSANVDNVSIEYPDPDTRNNHTATTLSNLLLSNSQIHRIYAHPASDKINISVVGTDKYPKVC
jgi:hypothetical protein